MATRTARLMTESGDRYRRAGAGTPLVLVHGYLGGSAQWEAEFAHFSGNFDVIAPDLPGFGDAADESGCERIGAMADRVIALLDSLGIDRFMLLGHSMGGMIVQEVAARVGDRIIQLVLYGTGPLGLMPDRFESIDQSRDRLRSEGVAKTIDRIGATWFLRGTDAPEHALVVKIGSCANLKAALAALDAMGAWDGRGALETIDIPTLVVWGDTDRSYRWPQIETLWKNLPNANLSVIPGTSHAAHLEKPWLFHAILDDFLSG